MTLAAGRGERPRKRPLFASPDYMWLTRRSTKYRLDEIRLT